MRNEDFAVKQLREGVSPRVVAEVNSLPMRDVSDLIVRYQVPDWGEVELIPYIITHKNEGNVTWCVRANKFLVWARQEQTLGRMTLCQKVVNGHILLYGFPKDPT